GAAAVVAPVAISEPYPSVYPVTAARGARRGWVIGPLVSGGGMWVAPPGGAAVLVVRGPYSQPPGAPARAPGSGVPDPPPRPPPHRRKRGPRPRKPIRPRPPLPRRKVHRLNRRRPRKPAQRRRTLRRLPIPTTRGGLGANATACRTGLPTRRSPFPASPRGPRSRRQRRQRQRTPARRTTSTASSGARR